MRDLVGLCVGQAGRRVDRELVYFFRIACRDFFNLHAAFGTGHQGYTLRDAIDDHADIQLFADVGALLHQQPLHQPSLRTGLMRHQSHAKDVGCVCMHLVERLRHFDAAAFAAAAGMDLRLDYPDISAQLARRAIGLGYRKAGAPRGVATPNLRRISLPWYS